MPKLNTDDLFFTAITPPGVDPAAAAAGMAEERLIRLLTRIVIGLSTTWWSLVEISDYVHKRRSLYDLNRPDDN